jgi:hypothetical protein
MKPTMTMTLAALAVATGLAIAPAAAQTTSGTATAPAPATTGTAATKLSGSFSDWAGSPENSTALVNGLRTGQPITLNSTGAPGGTITTTTFAPPTKPMGYGNIRIALSLAQQQLASQGITQPTPQQLQTALVGGQVASTNGAAVQTTDMQGVLQMRASGMGWGKIANTMGYKLGAVMSGKAAAVPTTTSTSSGITTAAGSSTGTGSAKIQHGKAGSGIVTASGGAGGGISTGMGSANAHGGAGSGIVSAHGGGGGQGQSHGGGQGKGGK